MRTGDPARTALLIEVKLLFPRFLKVKHKALNHPNSSVSEVRPSSKPEGRKVMLLL